MRCLRGQIIDENQSMITEGDRGMILMIQMVIGAMIEAQESQRLSFCTSREVIHMSGWTWQHATFEFIRWPEMNELQ